MLILQANLILILKFLVGVGYRKKYTLKY